MRTTTSTTNAATTNTTARTVVITRHQALVAYLLELGLVSPGVQVIPHVGADQLDILRDAHVFGVLPHNLAALAAKITMIPLRIPRERFGIDLSLEEMRQYIAGPPTTFKVVDHGEFGPRFPAIDLVVGKDRGVYDFLMEEGVIKKGTEYLQWVEDISVLKGRHVAGTLSVTMTADCTFYTNVPLLLPRELRDKKSLSPEDVRRHMTGPPRTYTIQRL